MAIDLARDERFDVSVADIDTGALGTLARQAAIRPVTRDLSHPEEVTDLVRDFDLVVDAVPGARNSQHRLGPEVLVCQLRLPKATFGELVLEPCRGGQRRCDGRV